MGWGMLSGGAEGKVGCVSASEGRFGALSEHDNNGCWLGAPCWHCDSREKMLSGFLPR
jgi:hypothetical protein